MKDVKIYFSDYFDVSSNILEEYGAINISLINDIPLFIDPFLLFNSEDPKLREIHDEMQIPLRRHADSANSGMTFSELTARVSASNCTDSNIYSFL